LRTVQSLILLFVFLMDAQVKSLVEGQKLITLDATENLHSVLQKLAQNNIISAPVKEGANTIGFVDVLDILSYLITETSKGLYKADSGDSITLKSDDMDVMKKRSKDFNLGHIRDIINASKRNPFLTIREEQPLRDALRMLRENDAHRIGVMKGPNSLYAMLSLTDIVKYLHSSKLTPKMTTKDVSSLKRRKLSITTTETRAIDAFTMMHRDNLSAMPVTDPQTGKVAAVISASDLRGFEGDHMEKLLQPIKTFLSDTQERVHRPTKLVTSRYGTPLGEALNEMLSNHTHRSFVLDDKEYPVGVISFIDVIHEVEV